MPVFCSPEMKLGPALRPTTPMKTHSPTVSKIQIAGSGIRPKNGYTDRSQPNTSPMIRAPPLAVRVSGRPPTVTESRPTSPPSTMPVPTKIMSVAVVGRSAYPSSFDRPLDLGLRADQAQHVAPIDARSGGNGDLLPGPHELSQEHATGGLEPRQLRQGLSDEGPVRDHHIQRLDRDVEQGLVVHFGTDLGPALHVDLLPGGDRDHVVLADDRGRAWPRRSRLRDGSGR